jgi:H/ACA ribonucleoprotein complex subunit 4
MPLLTKDARPGKAVASAHTLQSKLRAGVIILDKPQGPTSHQVTAWVRDILGTKKIGHGGTLDPNVSGVLPITLGTAVRATDLVLRSDKEYVCHLQLHRDKPEARVRDVVSSFTGEIYQIPPVRSAVKRQLRTRRIKEMDILEVSGRNVLFRVDCDAGTYIRTLCVDIGEALGAGGNMQALRRTRSGLLREKDAVTLHDLKDATVAWKEGDPAWLDSMVHPMEILFDSIPRIIVKDTAVDALCHGADLMAPGIGSIDASIKKGDLVALMTNAGEAIGLAHPVLPAEELMRADKGLAARLERVLMEPGRYKKHWTKKEC